MFDDFAPHPGRKDRRRQAGSMVAAIAVYGGLSALLIVTSAKARQLVEEKLVQVAFRPPPPEPEPKPAPEPEPVVAPPEPKPEPPKPRPRAKRQPIKPPAVVPEEKPPESDAALVPAEPPAPVEGFLDGAPGGQGSARTSIPGEGSAVAPPIKPAPPAPRPAKREKLTAPVALKTVQPKYPTNARRKGIEGVVVVSFEVLEDGRVTAPRIVSGPEELHQTVLATVVTWRFQPARLGAKPVRQRIQYPIRFRLDES